MKLVHGLALSSVLWLLACAQPPADGAVRTALDAFYDAIQRGDAAGAMAMVAPDAVFVESGRLETREEYERNHLPADIAFERQVSAKRGPLQVRVQDDTAWVIATTDYDGTFDGKPVSSTSAQLTVLTRTDERWLIRSIHWSSHRR
jgi:ketosteroid isomerase-like protein